ncbi:MAG: hypothetical protein FWF44_07575, partial [Defluviitaleaceae bacterium]|nr:hypothetical protein [Defluviitaleaceae bacterium]
QYDMFKLAGCGGAVVYRDIHSALTLYSIKDRRAVKITGYTSDMYFQISPDGGTVIYSSGGALYVYTDGRSTPVGEDMTAVAVSDGGKCIYSYNSHIYDPQAGWSETLYVSSAGGELKKLGSGVDTDVIVFNADNTQALYASYHIGYISVNAGEGIEVGAGGWATPCLPEGAVGCASLLNKVYGEGSYSNGEGHVYYVDDKFKTTTLVSNCSSWKIDASAKTLCYVDNSSNNLYRCSVQNPPAAVEIGQDVGDVGFCVSPDGERVYYVNSSGELWRKSGNSAAVKLLDGVYNYISMSTDGTLLCVTSSGTGEFYTCKDGGNMVKAAEITGDYNFAFSMGGFMYYLTESDPDSMYGKPDYDDYPCDLYGSADGVRFSLMCGGMQGYAPAMNNFNL